MDEDKDHIFKYAWEELVSNGLALVSEIQADDTVLYKSNLLSDDEFTPRQKSKTRIEAMESHVQSLIDALSEKNKTELISCVSSIEQAGYADEEVYWYIEELKNNFNLLGIKDAELIYTIEQDEIFIPELILPAQERIFSLVKNNPSILHSITPREFEELVAEIFDRQGFDVELTKATRDGGKDIIAIQSNMGIKLKYIVECKRYAMHNKVTLDVVQRLYGVKMAEKANKAILVTTSSFTKDASKFASQHCWDLSLKDKRDLLSWLK